MNIKIKGFLLAMLIGVSASAAAAPAPAATLPDINADEYFDGQGGGTFGKKVAKMLPNSKRVAIGGFRVIYITENAVKAQVRASYLPGRDQTAAHASMNVSLTGVDNATLQALTDKAYASFVEQLTLAGREVVPMEQMQALYTQLEAAKTEAGAPYTKEIKLGASKRMGVGFSPTGIPLWWHNWDSWGDAGFSQSNFKKFTAYSKDVEAFIIAPVIVVDFAQMESSGNRSGLMAREASVGASLSMSVPEMNTQLARAEQVKFGQLSKGDQASINMTQGFSVDVAFADMEVVEERKTTGLMAIMTGSSKSKSTRAASTDNERYSAAAAAVLNKATGGLAKFFQQHSP